jgi:Ni/Co efflux regulator RcnB
MSIMKRLLIVFFLLTSSLFAVAQTPESGSAPAKKEHVSRKVKKAEQKKAKQQRNLEKAALKGKKRHENIQDKSVRKRMKRHRKGPIHVDAYDRRPFFLKRWLKRKEH